MIAAAFLAATALNAQSPPGTQIVLHNTRDPSVVGNYTEVHEGICDGRRVSVRVTKSFRQGAGRIAFNYGRLSREIPTTFANGLLVRNTMYAAALACDGRRLDFIVHVAQIRGAPELRYYSQTATLDLRSGRISLSELRQEEAREFSAHVQ